MGTAVPATAGPAEGTTRPHSLVSATALFAMVCLALLAAHWPVLSSRALSFDDLQYLVANPLVQRPSWNSARRFLTEVRTPSTVEGYYQPLAMISLMADCAIGGRSDYFRPFHRTSLALHVVNTVLVMVLIHVLFGQPWVAAMAGLLFGLHPLHVEAIATIGERKTLLSPFFALLCLIVYVRYARRPGGGSYAACLALYALALMSKPTSTPLPLLFLLLDYWPLRRLGRRAILEKLPFFAIGTLFAWITVVSQGQFAPVPTPGDYPFVRVPLILCHNIIFYLSKIVWPTNLSVHYPYPEPLGLANPMVLAGVIGTCVLILVLAISLRWTPAFAVGTTFFFMAILPTMGIVGFTVVLTSDKYVYFPSVGLLLALAWVLVQIWQRPSPVRHIAPPVVVLVLAVGEVLVTRQALVPWSDTVALYKHMATLAPRALIVRNNLGLALAEQGRPDEAIRQFEEALRINPRYELAHRNLADIFLRQGDVDQAIAHYTEALRLDPNAPAAHFSLGNLLLKHGRLDEAAVHFSEAVRLKPDMPEALNNLGAVLLRQGKIEEAITALSEVVRLWPDFPNARKNLAAALARRQSSP